jgi:uncharacterized protein (DUF697 family)
MNYINQDDRAKCHAIIHTASSTAGAVGAGLCWFPMSDAPLISAVQIAMTISLGKVFGIKLTKSAAKAAVAAAAATAAGRAASQLATFWIPFANIAINASTAVGLTEFIGWTLAEEFSEQAKKENAESAA